MAARPPFRPSTALAGSAITSLALDRRRFLGLAGALGTALGATTLRLEDLAAESLAATVRSVREAA